MSPATIVVRIMCQEIVDDRQRGHDNFAWSTCCLSHALPRIDTQCFLRAARLDDHCHPFYFGAHLLVEILLQFPSRLLPGRRCTATATASEGTIFFAWPVELLNRSLVFKQIQPLFAQ